MLTLRSRPIRRFDIGAYVSGDDRVTGEASLLMTDKAIKRDGTVTLCIYNHGRSSTAREPIDDRGYDYTKVARRLVDLGVPVISADLSSGVSSPQTNHWGNDTALGRIDMAWAFAATKLGVRTDRIVIAGASMGALTSLNYTRANPSKVLAVGGLFPAIDMDDSGLSAYASEMQTMYGGSTAFTAAKPTHNPAAYAASMTKPTRLIYSTGDTIARPGPITTYAAAASNVAVRPLASAGPHITAAMTDADAQWLADWLAGYAKS